MADALIYYPRASERATSVVVTFHTLAEPKATRRQDFARHQHLQFEVIVVIGGRYRCAINGVGHQAAPGEVVVVQPGDWHEDGIEPAARLFGLLFHARIGGSEVRLFHDAADVKARVLRIPLTATEPQLERLRHEQRIGDRVSSALQDAITGEFFWRLVRAVPQSSLSPMLVPESEAERFSARLLQLFAEHERSPLPVSAMARRFGLAPTTFAARCRAWLRVSPAKAFSAFKMGSAKAMLAGTDMSVGEVADRFGFENAFHFSRVFRRHVGVPPSEIARRKR